MIPLRFIRKLSGISLLWIGRPAVRPVCAKVDGILSRITDNLSKKWHATSGNGVAMKLDRGISQQDEPPSLAVKDTLELT